MLVPKEESVATTIYQPPNWLDPFVWNDVFGRQAAVEVDIGCGKGTFLLWAAAQQPDHNFLGVDRLLVRLRKVDKRVLKAGMSNVRLVRIEISYLLSKLVPAGSVTTYHILFPDPWPKRRHHHKRLINAAVIGDLHRTLRPGGVVNFATDHEQYFTSATGLFRESGKFEQREAPVLPEEARTDFEREFLGQGKVINRANFVRLD
jgi:tRNA (guanine-N7-)-methyltransferase